MIRNYILGIEYDVPRNNVSFSYSIITVLSKKFIQVLGFNPCSSTRENHAYAIVHIIRN